MMCPSTGGSVRCLLDTISGGAPTLHPRLAVHPSSKVLGIDALDFFELGLGFGALLLMRFPGEVHRRWAAAGVDGKSIRF